MRREQEVPEPRRCSRCSVTWKPGAELRPSHQRERHMREPVRADELFSSGSVVEQIWEQIEKAKVLLADLTGKNANVFYELGLAHARGKPVIFTSGVLEDVPFDLRHLRVIIYEVHDPSW